ncbi:transcription initiation factor TFIID subunit 11 [Linnemannia schmuckeri]|uniref:Transcription initiation factor TFIID subunit 11 n=1 Tax=Linnemannia schmuckeri TaxID=64567 RepID=A0A9P5UVG2_9FUNG|nr:transcription initiation factor TFIID subunit 11 [Linnemannia schmuckeri]
MDESASSPAMPGGGGAGAPSPGPAGPSTPATPTKRRKNAAATPSLHKPKKQKLPRNLDSITARNQLPNVPAAGGVGKSGQRMVKGPYKKREKKDKDGKKIPAGAAGATGTGTAGGKKAKGGAAGKAGAAGAAAGGAGANAGNNTTGEGANRADSGSGFGGAGGAGLPGGARDEDGDDSEIRKPGVGPNGATVEGGETGGEAGDAGGEGKDEDDDDHEEEPEYTEYEWNQEASTRGRSKDELKALLDCFSDEQLQRYEVYRRSVLGRSTVKKLVGTILNQQVTQTMAFVVAGFCKVFVGEMVEKAREVMEDWGETGPIRPEHLREAQRRYKKEEVQRGKGVQTSYGYKRRMFCR